MAKEPKDEPREPADRLAREIEALVAEDGEPGPPKWDPNAPQGESLLDYQRRRMRERRKAQP